MNSFSSDNSSFLPRGRLGRSFNRAFLRQVGRLTFFPLTRAIPTHLQSSSHCRGKAPPVQGPPLVYSQECCFVCPFLRERKIPPLRSFYLHVAPGEVRFFFNSPPSRTSVRTYRRVALSPPKRPSFSFLETTAKAPFPPPPSLKIVFNNESGRGSLVSYQSVPKVSPRCPSHGEGVPPLHSKSLLSRPGPDLSVRSLPRCEARSLAKACLFSSWSSKFFPPFLFWAPVALS